jgi:hypothetical protein
MENFKDQRLFYLCSFPFFEVVQGIPQAPQVVKLIENCLSEKDIFYKTHTF